MLFYHFVVGKLDVLVEPLALACTKSLMLFEQVAETEPGCNPTLAAYAMMFRVG
jgi:hypothetical protein